MGEVSGTISVAKVIGVVSVEKVAGTISAEDVIGEITYQGAFIPNTPTVTTTDISNITDTTADGGGNVTSEGTSPVTMRGVCWSTSENPTIADDKTEDGSGIGIFTSELTGLIAETTYYVRAYATNEVGTSYGEQKSFETIALYCAEFQTVYDSWTIKPTDADAAELNIKVEKMVADGIWAINDIYYNFAVHTNDNGEAQTNWINPGTHDAILVNNPTFVAFEGFKGDGTTQYINTNYNPNTDAINLALDDACGFLYNRTDGQSNTWMYGCRNDSKEAFVITPWALAAPDKFYHACNSGYGDTYAVTDAFGMHLMSRDNNANYDAYKNKVGINSIKASSAIPNYNIYLLAMNNAGTAIAHSPKQISCAGAGGAFTQTNVDDLIDAFETWMDYKGKGVIP